MSIDFQVISKIVDNQSQRFSLNRPSCLQVAMSKNFFICVEWKPLVEDCITELAILRTGQASFKAPASLNSKKAHTVNQASFVKVNAKPFILTKTLIVFAFDMLANS